ncbi:MAG: phosphate ABC transporter permease PstA [Deltaproteobacteria bacterium]|nr:phosphate ABC transporter permease PstA [Candidatus Tharpella sp.]
MIDDGVGRNIDLQINSDKVRDSLGRRYQAEKRFRRFGILAIVLSLFFLVILFAGILQQGLPAFFQTRVRLSIFFDPARLPPENLERADFDGLVKKSCRRLFPEVRGRRDRKSLYKLVSAGAAYELRDKVLENQAIIGTEQELWLLADDELDMLMKGNIARDPAGRFNQQQLNWIEKLERDGRLRRQFNCTFFIGSDSRDPESAGILGALSGTLLTLALTLILSFPVGIGAAVYLEEFLKKGRLSDVLEVNINNLAAVPSIIFGLLGLGVFINFFGLPRSSPLVGGLVLSLMTLPTIIISSRAAIKAVPPSIRAAALGLGASPMQAVFHHVLPLAMPGILTGTIIGMARALGETAPLMMVGMVAFIVDIPKSLTSAATVLPVQIYLWADSPERAFTERTSAAIIVLLFFLILMNATAVSLRRKFERRW